MMRVIVVKKKNKVKEGERRSKDGERGGEDNEKEEKIKKKT